MKIASHEVKHRERDCVPFARAETDRAGQPGFHEGGTQ
jgi:hypothetical protein